MTTPTPANSPVQQVPPYRDRRAEASKYQRDILEWIKHGQGDAVVEAVAGSGKTTTLEMAWQQVQESYGQQRAIFLAFNKTVATELQARLIGMTARTLHSLGNQPTRARIGRSNVDVVDYKYANIVRSFLKKFGIGGDAENRFLVEDLSKVIDLARYRLTDLCDVIALQRIVDHYNIGRGFGKVDRYLWLIADVCDVGLRQALDEGRIDFADQLWIPHVANLPVTTYGWIFVDESQDLNVAQLELVLRSRAPGGRILFVGDQKQAIYGFAGADSEAMKCIGRATHAVRLPLSITYRCARSHVEVARQFAPALEARPGAPEGVFADISIEGGMALMQPGDLVLCRETAPTVELQRVLDDQSRDAYVEDETRRKRLKALLSGYYRQGVEATDVVAELKSSIGRLEQGDDTAIGKLDRLDTLKALHAALRGRHTASYAALAKHIDRVFAPRNRAVRCMTIHKSKGLEADRVFLIRPDLLPHRHATLPWQLEQEENLRYVALTRAKTELYICHGEIALRPDREQRDRRTNATPFIPPVDTTLPQVGFRALGPSCGVQVDHDGGLVVCQLWRRRGRQWERTGERFAVPRQRAAELSRLLRSLLVTLKTSAMVEGSAQYATTAAYQLSIRCTPNSSGRASHLRLLRLSGSTGGISGDLTIPDGRHEECLDWMANQVEDAARRSSQQGC